MENIKNKIDNNTKIETLLFKIKNQKHKDELYSKNQEIIFQYIVDLQSLFNDYNKLSEISMKILESNFKKSINSFSNSLKINDDLIDSKLSKISQIDDRIYKNSDKIYKVNLDINTLFKVQFILVLGFIYLLYDKFL